MIRFASARRSLVSAACLLALAGCTTEPPRFVLNREGKKADDLAPLSPSDLTKSEKAELLKYLGTEDFQKKSDGAYENLPDYLRQRVASARQQLLVDTLDGLFGTPDAPYAFPESGLDQGLLAAASGPTGSHAMVVRHIATQEDKKVEAVNAGPVVREDENKVVLADRLVGEITIERKNITDISRQRGLFRQHCVHCHGITGDGYGPTAEFLQPYPRDFRMGKFKFTSTNYSSPPTRDDLHRTLNEGIPGTAMPSFRLLAQDEREALVEYVAYLALRGQVENLLPDRFAAGEDLTDPETRAAIVEQDLLATAERWKTAGDNVVTPKERAAQTPELYAASVEAGRKLFTSEKAQCGKCHGPNGYGDGWQSAPHATLEGEYFAQGTELDDWNKIKVNAAGNLRDPHLFALPGQQVRPRNLRMGIFRGGRRPVDIFRRISASIKGTAMPELGKSLTPEEIWNLVDYVRQMPFEEQGPGEHLIEAPGRDRM